MTVQQARADLPAVQVRWGGKVYCGRVSGRLNPFACVSISGKAERGRPFVTPMLGPCFEFSWEAVARAATNNTPLRAD